MSTAPIGWCVDLECDNLYLLSTKVWYIRMTSLDGKRTLALRPTEMSKEDFYVSYMEWVNSFPDGALVVAHNGLGFDLWIIWRLLGIKPRVGKNGKDYIEDKHVQYCDTYVLSMFLTPDKPKHSLAYLSSGSEDEKMDFRSKLIEAGALEVGAAKGAEFSQWHPLMAEYCDDDVKATIGVFNRLWALALEMYGKDKWLHPSFRQIQKDYWLYSAQAYTGVRFNVEKANVLVTRCEAEMEKLRSEVEPHLPPRPLKSVEEAFYKISAKPFTKSGEYSANFIKWLAKHEATVVDKVIHAYGKSCPLVANEIFPVELPMEIDDNVEMKDYFLQNKWKPTFWNYKKDPVTGKPMRDEKRQLIETTPKIQQAGVICPNLLKLNGEIPAKVVRFLSYRNRLGVVNGWLNNWRLPFDGRISASISGYTPTFRVKHSVIVNVPKASEKVLLGHEMRDLWYVDDGEWYIGADSASLENRTIAAYAHKHDGGAYAELVLNGDSHTFNSFAFFPHLHSKFDINEEGLKDKPEFKPYRDLAKTGVYLLMYGGGVPKLASSLNLSKSEGQRAYDGYWKSNEGLGKLKTAVEKYYDGPGKKKHLPAIDGRILSIRGKNVLINMLGQSCGAVAQSMAACLMDNRLGELHIDELGRPYYRYKGKVVKRISSFHDEYSFSAEDGVEEEVRQMMVKCIVDGGAHLKLAIPLDGEGKMSRGGSWMSVH